MYDKLVRAISCAKRNHCVACRTDAFFRELLRKSGLVDSADFACPHGVTAETAPAIQAEAVAKLRPQLSKGEIKAQAAEALKRKILLEEQGRAAWAWLHENASTDSLTKERLAGEFLPMIPAYGCQCTKEWREIVQNNPLPATGQYDWSIARHNDVNLKLGKPAWNT